MTENEDKIVQALLDTRKEIGKDQLKALVHEAIAAGGKVVTGSYDPVDGDQCGTGVRFPWPPKPHTWDFVTKIVSAGGRVDLFPIGIPHPEEILVNVRSKGVR